MNRDAYGNFRTSISCSDARRELNSSLAEWEKNAFANLEKLMEGKGGFPCLFGMAAFRKSHMQIAFQESLDSPNSVQAASDCFIQFSDGLTETRPKERYLNETILFMFRTLSSNQNDSDLTVEDRDRICWTFLEKLHELDPEPWPEEATKDSNDVDFRYYFSSKNWLPMFFSPFHNLETRLSENCMVLFQPTNIFSFHEKDNRHFFSIREKVRGRIEKAVQGPVPPYIIDYDGTPRTMQFLGLSETDDDSWQCPMSVK